MIKNAVYDLVRPLFMILDTIVYGLIATIYNLIENVTHYRLFANGEFITDKVYTLLSIFMLFKVSFSFINYLINPDSLTDKEKGVQHVIKNIVIMFIMLVMSPWAFRQMWGLQDAILKENVLAQFVFGDQNTKIQNQLHMWDICEKLDNNYQAYAATNGDYIALMTLRTFYKPYEYKELGYSVKEADWKSQIKASSICDSVAEAKPIYYLNPDTVKAYIDDGKLWNGLEDKDLYLIDYTILISTAVGIVVLLILVSFAMDVGVRLVKLSFLQLIAPIPIVSFIEPSSSKNGMFIKWLKEVGATWASVFVRLFALFFGVRVIQEVGAQGLTAIDSQYPEANMWVMLIVIIGALMFAKQLPKLITDLTGIKMDGGFNLNPMKKIRDEALGGKLVTGGITGAAAGGLALAGGMAANAWALGNKVKKDGWQKSLLGIDKDGNTRDFFNGKTGIRGALAGANSVRLATMNSVGSVMAGGGSSAMRAIAKGKDGTWHPLKNAAGGITESSNARNLRDKGYDFDDKLKDNITKMAGVKFSTGTTSSLKNKINELEQDLANSRRNEQAMTTAFNQRISEMGNMSTDLLTTFNWEAAAHDSKGNVTSYATKTYEQYIAQATGATVDRETFDSLNNLYNAINREDIAGKKLEKEINDYKDDIGKFKGDKK